MPTTTSQTSMTSRTSTTSDRRDKLGRRIGYNWWREFIWGEWRCAYDAWHLAMDEESIGYETERREYRHNNPSPKFKDFLIAHAGQHNR